MAEISNSINMSFRVDRELKKEADTLFKKLGLNTSVALNMFLHQSVREQGLPFNATMDSYKPNKTLLKALKEAEKIRKDPNRTGYSTVNELFEALDE